MPIINQAGLGHEISETIRKAGAEKASGQQWVRRGLRFTKLRPLHKIDLAGQVASVPCLFSFIENTFVLRPTRTTPHK